MVNSTLGTRANVFNGTQRSARKYGLSECIKSGIIQSQQIGDIPLVLPRQRHSLRKLLEHKIGQLNVVYEIDGLHLLMDSLIHLDLASVRPGSACLQGINTSCNCLRSSTRKLNELTIW